MIYFIDEKNSYGVVYDTVKSIFDCMM